MGSIEENAFYDCSSLTSIIIPNSVIAIERNTFSGCSGLASVTIPDSVTSIGGGAFSDCSSLTSITIPNSVIAIWGFTFSGCSSLGSITIPDSVESIEAYAFADCSSLTSIIIPNGATSIARWAFDGSYRLNIYGVANSDAHKYAKDNFIKFQCLSHENIATIQAVEPTCTETGFTEGKQCKDCETIVDGHIVVPAKGHTPGTEATCIAAQTCAVCQTELAPAKGHSAMAPIITKATVKADGSIVTKCICGEVLSTDVIKKASKITLSKTAYTYTNKKIKAPTVVVKNSDGKVIAKSNYTIVAPKNMKAIGKYTYTIKFKGDQYSGTQKVSLEIKPAKTTIKAPAAAKKAVTVKWKKGTKAQATGYQVMVATNSKFTKNAKTVNVKGYKVTSKKVSKLKAKTKYFVKVRTYKTVKGVKIYSDWSKVKTCRTK